MGFPPILPAYQCIDLTGTESAGEPTISEFIILEMHKTLEKARFQ
ncbi:hypothetical protein Q672_07185 [Marinobacter sp. EVN1]|jgi:hypothetical protein|nr:hypothetical protein Q672_07185 [Marinobacter sp. EVN1]